MGQDSITDDPFTLVFNQIWSILENSPLFTADVAVGNRIKYNLNNKRNPFKQQINDSDLPEVVLISTGMDVRLFNTSSTTKIIKRYSVLLSTGDLRINNLLYQIQWDLVVCLTGWQVLLGQLLWPENTGVSFVKRADILDTTEGLSDPERNRGVVGWSSVMNLEVEMHFNSQDLINQRGY